MTRHYTDNLPKITLDQLFKKYSYEVAAFYIAVWLKCPALFTIAHLREAFPDNKPSPTKQACMLGDLERDRLVKQAYYKEGKKIILHWQFRKRLVFPRRTQGVLR